jgi:pimeloyl-ACP methyl ester carboxylesterase
VIFVHGNGASATFWEETMLALPPGFRAVAPDLRGYGDTEPLPVDATLGLGDMVEDVRSLVEALGLGRHHLVGHSMGGGVVMKYAIAHPADLLSITLVDTVSPYGYSGSKDLDGTPCHEDGAPPARAASIPTLCGCWAPRIAARTTRSRRATCCASSTSSRRSSPSARRSFSAPCSPYASARTGIRAI